MMEIMSFGNQIRNGEYKVHSRFSSAINFISGDSFVYVVNESVGAGPVNIVVNEVIPREIDSLEVGDTHFKFNGVEFNFNPAKCYDSAIDILDYDHDLFVKNLGIVESIVVEKGPEKSLSFLLENKNVECRNKFEEECRRIIKEGVDQILYGDIITGVKMIKGLGPGLTPSGDDFNSGLLIAMNVVNRLEEWNPAFAAMTNRVYEAAKGKNLFTNSFLSCAANGYLFYKFRELIRALQFTKVKEIINSTELVMTMGETSGADQLTGFLIGMKRFLK